MPDQTSLSNPSVEKNQENNSSQKELLAFLKNHIPAKTLECFQENEHALYWTGDISDSSLFKTWKELKAGANKISDSVIITLPNVQSDDNLNVNSLLAPVHETVTAEVYSNEKNGQVLSTNKFSDIEFQGCSALFQVNSDVFSESPALECPSLDEMNINLKHNEKMEIINEFGQNEEAIFIDLTEFEKKNKSEVTEQKEPIDLDDYCNNGKKLDQPQDMDKEIILAGLGELKSLLKKKLN